MIRIYFKVWAALLALLALTVGAAFVPLGPFNTITAISIAVTKAVIIALYFMHLRYSPRLTWIVAGAGFFWLLLLFTFALGEYATRSYMPSPTVWLP
jgi:cytochrome c oxidase subunit 4